MQENLLLHAARVEHRVFCELQIQIVTGTGSSTHVKHRGAASLCM